ncbi:MAG: metalloprotease TldD [Oceanococcus sp.]
MSDNMDLATSRLLAPASLQIDDLHQVLHGLMRPGVDAADLYFQARRTESWSLEEGIIKSGGYAIEQGVGVRAISGEATGFAYSDELERPALEQACQAAGAIARAGENLSMQAWKRSSAHALYQPTDPIMSLSADAKIDLLRRADARARAIDPAVSQVMASLVASHEHVLVAASDGTLASDIRPLVRMQVQVIVERGDKRESASSGGGGRFELSLLDQRVSPEELAEEAVRLALLRLDADAAPAGSMPVVLGPGWPGVLLHEAVGHGLEGDFNRKGSSVYSGRIGEKVASELCTIVDDGTLEQRRGSLNVDDEGTATQCNVLIENGILKGYLQDKLNAGLMGVAATGNGRRESFAHLPMPRMTNTFMRAGSHDPEDIIASVEKGLYARNFEGGQVDITSGNFVFSASEAYLIENGKLGRPVKGATIIGNGPEALVAVSMVGNDLELDSGIGVCGKDGQSVPVGVGQPTLKLDELTVGGTQA